MTPQEPQFPTCTKDAPCPSGTLSSQAWNHPDREQTPALKRRDLERCVHCGRLFPVAKPTTLAPPKPKKEPVVYKPTERNKEAILLAADVQYHVIRYVRQMTITVRNKVTEVARTEETAKADVMRRMAIQQARQLIKDLENA